MRNSENNPQLTRYKKLLAYLDDHLSEEINIEKVEEICHYSYRNINRIFEAIHNETIGKYIKRLRLEKAAQFLKYSDVGISQIAYQVGFDERAAFSKAFKKRYGKSPKHYRSSSEAIRKEIQKRIDPEGDPQRQKLKFEIEYLPDFEYLFLECRGNLQDIDAIYAHWQTFIDFAKNKGLISQDSILMTEIIDDEEISDQLNSRYRHALILEKPLDFEPPELYRIKSHNRQKYAKFTHQGSPQSSVHFYQKIYAFWMVDVQHELADAPVLEFYLNFDENQSDDSLITEIYIPIA
ncbi:MAG: GyrI-like domain-containing protein [Cyclobacteriaceae bacterium]